MASLLGELDAESFAPLGLFGILGYQNELNLTLPVEPVTANSCDSMYLFIHSLLLKNKYEQFLSKFHTPLF